MQGHRIKAVIFDMYETLITHYESPLYFGAQMAQDAGIPEESFKELWRLTESDRAIGKLTLEEALEIVLRGNRCYSEEILSKLVRKRKAAKVECFQHLHEEIIPMMQELQKRGLRIGLISNCFSEEAEVIRESRLFPFFDAAYLSYEQGIQKPEKEIFIRCMDSLSVRAEECVYVGDGGSFELETASELGMKAVQAVWYLKEGTTQPSKRNNNFVQAETPLGILKYL